MTTTLLMLSAHLLGDFPLQPRWMAEKKLEDPRIRLIHVGIHVLLMYGFLTVAGINVSDPDLFYLSYAATHFFIDSRRWGKDRDDFPTWQYVLDQVAHVTALAWCGVLFL